ncbi:MAG TPA: coniferyl aldehyde dehydrogenase [Polyangiaceae bacterium]|jgi:acyl-CoA reductase-like NAD-dependent aldehyde dehydrogenase
MTTSAATFSSGAPAAAQPPFDMAATLARMKDAQRREGAPDTATRIARLERLDAALLRRKGALTTAVSRDFGHRAAVETLVGEVFAVHSAIGHAKAHVREWMEAEDRDVSWVFFPSRAEVVAQPLGVVGIIAPWNYPIQLALSPLVGVIAAGNRAMIKPSEYVPETVSVLGDLLAEAFGASGTGGSDLVGLVRGGPEVGEAFSRLPFDHLVFTGSTRVGKLVMRAASENLVPVTLELGGKSPVIVAPDFSVRAAADLVASGKLFNAGQTCVAPDYALLPKSAAEGFVEAYRASIARMYPTLRDNPDYTSIIDDKQLARLRAYIEDAKERGARVVEVNPAGESFEGTRKMAPAVVIGVAGDMLLDREEIFGPILPVVTYEKVDEAIAYVNDRPRPLALYCLSHDGDFVDAVLGGTVSGGAAVNETLIHLLQDDLPFGGVGPSGMGHYHGREGFDTFSKRKPIYRQSRAGVRGLLRPPYGKTASAILRLLVGN